MPPRRGTAPKYLICLREEPIPGAGIQARFDGLLLMGIRSV